MTTEGVKGLNSWIRVECCRVPIRIVSLILSLHFTVVLHWRLGLKADCNNAALVYLTITGLSTLNVKTVAIQNPLSGQDESMHSKCAWRNQPLILS